jgi:hypothetical protein
MSFREKSAWISFVVVLVTFGAYFVSISGDLSIAANISHHAAALVGLMAVITAVTVVEIAAHILVALSSPAAALGGGVWLLVQATLFAVWVAELTRFGTQIYYCRRGLA